MINSRKSDFVLVVCAVLILWGPGMTLSRFSRSVPVSRVAQTSQAEASNLSSQASRAEASNPCSQERLPEAPVPQYGDLAAVTVTVTGYSSTVSETDETPGLTATNTEAHHGVIALSQDLLKEFTPGAPFSFHDTVEIPGLGRFQIEDTMHPRWSHRADVWFASRDQALGWGLRNRRIYRLPHDSAVLMPLPGRDEVAATFGSANFQ